MLRCVELHWPLPTNPTFVFHIIVIAQSAPSVSRCTIEGGTPPHPPLETTLLGLHGGARWGSEVYRGTVGPTAPTPPTNSEFQALWPQLQVPPPGEPESGQGVGRLRL